MISSAIRRTMDNMPLKVMYVILSKINFDQFGTKKYTLGNFICKRSKELGYKIPGETTGDVKVAVVDWFLQEGIFIMEKQKLGLRQDWKEALKIKFKVNELPISSQKKVRKDHMNLEKSELKKEDLGIDLYILKRDVGRFENILNTEEYSGDNGAYVLITIPLTQKNIESAISIVYADLEQTDIKKFTDVTKPLKEQHLKAAQKEKEIAESYDRFL